MASVRVGLLADIEPPEIEARIAILRKEAAVEAVALPDDVAMYIASSIKSNVRALEGALIRLAAYASLAIASGYSPNLRRDASRSASAATTRLR